MVTATSPAAHHSEEQTCTLEDIKRLVDISDILQALRALNDEETKVDEDLDTLMGSQPDLEAKLDRLETLRPQLGQLQHGSVTLVNTITLTSNLAETISAKVRQLDLEQSRVKQAIHQVEDIQELKNCVLGVQKALKDKDYETAANHIHSSMKLDRKVVEGSLADYALPVTANAKNAGELLIEARQQLSDIIAHEFEAAAQSDNEDDIRRYFKLFPLIGKTNVGLDKYARYLCGLVSGNVQTNMRNPASAPLYFANILTKLVEHMARIVDERLPPIVDVSYGPGYALRIYERLQEECDRQAKIIFETFMDERQIVRKLHEIRNFDPAKRSPTKSAGVQEGVVDPRELDIILTEMAKMRHHAHLFERFLQSRAQPNMKHIIEQGLKEEVLLPVEPGKYDEHGLLRNSGMAKLMRELMSHFLIIQEFFIKKSIDKAIKIDEYETGNLSSSCVDDVFYILKKSCSQSLSSSDADTVCGMNGLISRALDTDYINIFQKKIAAIMAGSDTRDARIGYMILVNNIDLSCEYLLKLTREVQTDSEIIFKSLPSANRDRIQSSFGLLTEAADRFRRILKTALEQLFNHAIRSKLRPLLAEAYRDIKYYLTEEEYAEQEHANHFAKRFNAGFDRLIELYRATLTESNYDQLMALALDCITKEWEKIIVQTKFNQLGSLRFDKDLRAVSAHLSSLTDWTSRDKFTRLQQISTLLNLEQLSEIYDYWGPKAGSITWLLTIPEIRKILALRMDFRSEDIAKLTL